MSLAHCSGVVVSTPASSHKSDSHLGWKNASFRFHQGLGDPQLWLSSGVRELRPTMAAKYQQFMAVAAARIPGVEGSRRYSRRSDRKTLELGSMKYAVPVNKLTRSNGTGTRLLHLPARTSFSGAESITSPELDIVTPLEAEEELSQVTLIWRAVKLPIYSVAVIPLTVGAAAAYLQTTVFNWGRYWLLLGSSVLVITWLNLSNDAYDAETGVDRDKKESVVNMTGSERGVLMAAYVCLALGFVGLVKAAQQAGDMRVTGLLTAAILCGYVYQCPPFRLSYKGLGEPLCFMAFGPLATVAFYLCQYSGVGALPVSLTVLGASVIVGITTSLILFCSHFHQIDGDLSVGKFSPLVKLGTEKGSKVVQAAVVSLYTIITLLTAVKALPLTCFAFSLLTLPVGRLVLEFIGKNHANKSLIFMAKYYCVRLHVALGLALVLGLSSAPMLPAGAAFCYKSFEEKVEVNMNVNRNIPYVVNQYARR